MGSSPGFASTTRDSCRRLKDSLSLRLASKLNLAAHRDSLAHSTKARRHTVKRCSDCSWARGFRRCFTPPLGVLFTFPSRYWFAIGRGRVFSLEGGPLLRAGFHVPRATRAGDPLPATFRVRGFNLFRRPSQAVPLDGWFVTAAEGCGPRLPRPTTPACGNARTLARALGLGWPGFARRYSRDLG